MSHNLPAELTTFVGRDPELVEIEGLVGQRRLVTLTGVGGCGKTRLAVQAGARLADRWADGVCLVDLGSVGDPAAVPLVVAGALGVPVEPDGDQVEALAAKVRGRELLLCLDTCEHVLDAAAAVGRDAAAPVSRDDAARDQPRTTRRCRRDGVAGPAAAAGGGVPALRGPGRPRRTPVRRGRRPRRRARACATRWTASRWRSSWPPPGSGRCRRPRSPPAWRSRSGCSPAARGARRRATGRWTRRWAGATPCSPRTRRCMFRRLAVFSGAFTLDAARAVGGDLSAEGGPAGTLRLIGRLLDTSLVTARAGAGEIRYRLLDTVRQYAEERLVAAGEPRPSGTPISTTSWRLAEAAEPGLDNDQDTWRLSWTATAPTSNAALRWGLAPPAARPDRGRRLAAALARQWLIRGQSAEGLASWPGVRPRPTTSRRCRPGCSRVRHARHDQRPYRAGRGGGRARWPDRGAGGAGADRCRARAASRWRRSRRSSSTSSVSGWPAQARAAGEAAGDPFARDWAAVIEGYSLQTRNRHDEARRPRTSGVRAQPAARRPVLRRVRARDRDLHDRVRGRRHRGGGHRSRGRRHRRAARRLLRRGHEHLQHGTGGRPWRRAGRSARADGADRPVARRRRPRWTWSASWSVRPRAPLGGRPRRRGEWFRARCAADERQHAGLDRRPLPARPGGRAAPAGPHRRRRRTGRRARRRC